MREIWKPVVGFEGLYEVSNRGRVKSILREVRYKFRGKIFIMKFEGKLLRIVKRARRYNSYVGVTLSKNGRPYQRFIHRLVLEAFNGRCPKGYECRHLDGDATNNNEENLKWGTRRENKADMIRHGRSANGARHGMAKLSNAKVKSIRRSVAKKIELAKRFGVDRMTIWRIQSGRSWNAPTI